MHKLTILFCFHNTDRYSGATKSLIDIISYFETRSDVEIIVVFPRKKGSAVEYFAQKNIKTIFMYYRELAYQMSEYRLKKALLYPMRILRYGKMKLSCLFLAKSVKKLNIDIVYTNTSTIFVGAFLNKYFKIPHIWHLREFREEDHGTRFFFGNKPFYHNLNKYTDEIIVLSKAMKNKISEYVINSQKIKVVYNDIGKENINPRTLWRSSGTVKCLIAGTLEPGKGQLDAIKGVEYALKKGIDITLDIAGSTGGSYYELLQGYCRSHGLEKQIHFLGFIKSLKEIRHTYDIAIVASLNEAFGRVTVEAMLSQMAVVGAAAGGTIELIDNGETGMLYPPGNYRELGEILCKLSDNRELLQKISMEGYQSGLKYTIGECAKEIKKLADGLVE